MQPQILSSPNPEGPTELEQFAFAAGEWDCRLRILQEDGSQLEMDARFVGTYTLDGYAFQDDFIVPYGKGLGTTWRTYDTVKEEWVCRWLQPGTDTSRHFSNDWFRGNFIDGEMRLRSAGSDHIGPFMDRIAFKNITNDGFVWTLTRSYDQGQTWIENLSVFEAKRRV